MKISNKIYTVVALVVATVFVTSCSEEFLNEELRTQKSTDYFKTEVGLTDLSESLYILFKWQFTTESGYTCTNYGTDEFIVAGDASNDMWNDYGAKFIPDIPPLNSNTQQPSRYWDELYKYISRCNTIIENAKADDELATPVISAAVKSNALGVAHFVRGYSYLFLVMQYGGVPLVTAAPTGNREFDRAPAKDIYELAIADLEKAYTKLPAAETQEGRLTKYAAAHFLAKAHLWRASEINDAWNADTKSADLQKVITYADEVIAAHPLESNFVNVYGNWTTYDCPIEKSSEIILAAQNTYDVTLKTTQNMMLCNFVAWYQSFTFMTRDVAGAREYQRLKTNPNYAYDLYDLKNDSRFWKSFKTTYAINNLTAKDITLGDGTTVKSMDYFTGEAGTVNSFNYSKYLSAMYVINNKEYGQKYFKNEVNVDKAPTKGSFTRIDTHTGKYIPTIMARWIYADENDANPTSGLLSGFETLYPMVNKHLDGSTAAANQGSGNRDGVLARSAEDYFFKAEALIKQNKINEGLSVLQILRDRAEYKAGEKRDEYVDGGIAYNKNVDKPKGFISAFYPYNSYYYSLGIAETTEASELPLVTSSSYPTVDQNLMNKLGYSSDYDKAMCFLLNEKSREMYGELIRWMDLARTKTLEKRIVLNAQVSAFDPARHYLRPIPQSFLDAIEKNGLPLTAEEKGEMQNPGYN